jgi:hypothetical protein
VRVTDEVDITAKDLPKVDSPSDPGITARPGVAETKADLSPVDEHRPAATLTLDEEPARSLDEESSAVDGKALARDLPESDEAKRHATKRRRAVPRALGGDGFEGPSLEPRQKLESPATPAPSRVERELVVVLVLFGLTAALIALGWFTLT